MTTKILVCFFLATCALLSVQTSSIASNPTINPLSLKKVFEGVKPYSDLSNAFYSINGLNLLGENLPKESQQEVCNFIKAKVDKTNLESIYYATQLSGLIPNCILSTADFQATLANGASSVNLPDLYFYAFASQNLKQPIDAKKISKSLTDGLKADSSIINQAYSLLVASLLPNENSKVFYDSIEDILDQADEVDKRFLQYEGGVGTTSLVLEGILVLSQKFNKLPVKFNPEKIVKFINYLTSKRFPTNIKSAYFLLKTSLLLTDNQFFVPVFLNRLSPVSVSATQPNILVSISNLLSGAVKQAQFNLEAESAKSKKGQVLFAGKKALTPKSSDSSAFELKAVEGNSQVGADFYTININLISKDKRFFMIENTVEVKFTTQINIVDVQVGVADRDSSAPKLTKVEENGKLKLDADTQTKLVVKFAVKDKIKSTLLEVHQAFVKFTETKSKREIIFLAQPGLNNLYSAEIDFLSNAKNFRQHSGTYAVELIVSDSLVENPLKWSLAEVKLYFGEEKSTPVDEKQTYYSARPEIKHLFRQPEPTPPTFVSMLFAALCIFPSALLILLWLGIGFNLSKLTVNLPAIIFHLSIAGIFGLFYCYWIKLNMFQTVRYLAVLAVIAFLSGNKLLKSLASSKEKTK